MRSIFLTLSLFTIGATLMAQPQIKARGGNTIPGMKSSYPAEWTTTSNIYEVNIRQYTPSGTINEFSTHLERLHNMGVEILWVMPIQPIGKDRRKGSLGSYYSISDYMAVNPEMGTMEDWVNMVNKAHSLGMKVILDWVGNHTAFDHAWTKTHPEYYNKNEKGEIKSPVDDWSDVADLNYDNANMRAAMIDALKFWIKASNIDGYRCDVAYMVPVDFWQDVRRQLEILHPGTFLLAEAEEANLHEKAFDMAYGWSFYHTMVDIAAGKKTAKAIPEYLEAKKSFPKNAYHMYFTSNHDENSWSKSEYDKFGGGVKTFAVLSFGLNGMPLIYSGQEAANAKTIRFFDKDTINFSKLPLEDFYGRLLKLKKQEPAMRHGETGGDMIILPNGKEEFVFSFMRKKENSKVLFVLNLSDKKQKIKLDSPELAGTALEIFGAQPEAAFKNQIQLTLEPWQYRVYTYKK
jgi:glycosidase